VSEQTLAGAVENQPQVLAAAVHRIHPGPGQAGREVRPAARVAAHGARVSHGHVRDPPPDHSTLQSGADGLDFGQFGHG
jgi:hypothetical protein